MCIRDSLYAGQDGTNPIDLMKNAGTSDNINNDVSGQANLRIRNLVKGLQINLTASRKYRANLNDRKTRRLIWYSRGDNEYRYSQTTPNAVSYTHLVVAAPPYYFAPSQPELTMYYKALADALPLPLCLYNMPVHVKVSLEPATVKELAGHPNIIGLKDSSSNMVYFQTLLYELSDRPDFALFMGPEQLTAESVMLGAAGGVNGGANVFPELYVALYEAAAANDLERVKALQHHVMAVAASLYTIGRYGSSAIKGIKCALSLMGICLSLIHISMCLRDSPPTLRQRASRRGSRRRLRR